MPKVALIAEDCGENKAKVGSELRTLCSAGVGEISRALNDGRPVFERQLFDRNDKEFP
jgi:hypothetical protein